MNETREQIIETNNILIDIFMGNSSEGESTPGSLYAEDLNYHSSWGSLMPVVEKIDSLDYITEIGIEYCEIRKLNEKTSEVDLIAFEAKGNKIDSVYHAVIEFIKYFNSLS